MALLDVVRFVGRGALEEEVAVTGAGADGEGTGGVGAGVTTGDSCGLKSELMSIFTDHR